IGLLAGAGLMLAAHAAQATPSLTFDVSVWNAATLNSTSTSPSQQALPTNPVISSGNLASTFTFTGLPEWAVSSQPNNQLGTFINSGGGTVSGQQFFNGQSNSMVLSTSNFASVSVFELEFTTTHSLSGTIAHDDGIGLFTSGGTYITGDTAPTSVVDTNFSIGPGSYDLVYVEANGAPSDLVFSNVAVPEPESIALFGMGLLGLSVLTMLRRSRT
ncbi:MAG TPA: PEP-CTERM sorting domain-containing protein, partial [Acetobacteraceae bacterium]|nr:PEP-CTERM sorting domain-containing protein [Acetobacteraceae bacterium]